MGIFASVGKNYPLVNSVGGITDVLEFFSEGLAIDAEYLGRFGLIIIHGGQDISNIFSFDLNQSSVKPSFPHGGEAHMSGKVGRVDNFVVGHHH